MKRATFAQGNHKTIVIMSRSKKPTMSKLMRTVMMLCLTLSGALCYALDKVKIENGKDGHEVSIELTEYTGASGSDRSSSIYPVINGHTLTVSFFENLGQVSVEVTAINGASVHCTSVLTPNGLQIYIPNTGDYIVTFTLPNGDVYAGEFTVTD